MVLEEITKALQSYGSELRDELAGMRLDLNPTQKKVLFDILEHHNRQWLSEVWKGWYYIKDDAARLEAALDLLAQFQSGLPPKVPLKTLLDRLAEEFSATHIKKDPYGLAYFLFEVKGLKGAKTDYYNPQNSNLIYVLRENKGIPISLACVYILTAARLGLEVEGCNFPGHFLARIELNGKKVFVDCFNGGRVVTQQELLQLQEDGASISQEVLRENVSPETVVSRFLGNLIQAYDQTGGIENSQLMFELLNTLELSHLRVKSAS